MAKKTSSNSPTTLVINKLVVRPLNRSVADIDTWRSALKQADNGRRQKLYELYEDLLIDSNLGMAIDKRIMAITNAKIVFMKGDRPIPEMDEIIDSPDFEEILTEIMNAKFWGKTVIELDYSNGLNPYTIPRQHLNVNRGMIVINATDDSGIPYKNDDFFLEAGKDKDFGIILKAAPYVIYKRGGFGDWAQFVELFGMPFRTAKYNANDEDTRQTLERAMEEAGSAPYLVVPKEAEIEIKDGKGSTGDGNLYDKLRKACNEEILVTILGQTMTTQNGSSRAQSETHKEVEEGINKSDRRFVQRILNRELLPRLEKRGFPVSGGKFTFAEEGETLTSEQQLNIHSRFKNELGLPIDDDFLYENYSIPKPKGAQIAAQPDPQRKDPKTTKKEEALSDETLVKSEWGNFWERLFSFFAFAPLAAGQTLSSQNQVCPSCGGAHPTGVNLADIPDFDNQGLIQRVAEGKSGYFDADLYFFIANNLVEGLRKGFLQKKLSLAVEYGFESEAAQTLMELNLFKFSAGKTLAQVQELNSLFRKAKSYREFEAAASKVSNQFNRAWQQTEYDTAYLVGESSGNYYRLKSQTDIFEYWQYITVLDGKVRESHLKLHGVTLRHDDPAWDSIYPPNDWNCRCRVAPLLKSETNEDMLKNDQVRVKTYMNSPEFKELAKHGWNVNRADIKMVFSRNQFYIKDLLKNEGKYLNRLKPSDFGMFDYDEMVSAAKEFFPKYTDTASNWWNLQKKSGKNAYLTDYNGRKIMLDEGNFKKHTNINSKDYKDRPAFLNALSEAVTNPDEVWAHDFKSDTFGNFVYIKFYKDEAIAVIARVKGGKVNEIKTWFNIRENEKTTYRRGLPLKK